MSKIIYILLFTVLCFSCKKSTETNYESEESNSRAGVFAIGSDTLKIEEEYDSDISFDISAVNENVQAFVFNTATTIESEEDYQKYSFSDSSEYTFEDLVFTYSYLNDTWTIDDLVWSNKLDTTRQIDLSGTYKRVE